MDQKVQAFLNEWNGKIIPFVNVLPGSCMAVAHQFILEVLGITDLLVIYGEFAYMVYTNFASLPAAKYFTLVPNTPTNVPSAGDIPIFGQTTDTPEGHICVFVSGDVNSFQSIDQNYPTGSPVHLQTHTYNGLLGWLHFNDPAASPTQNVPVTNQQVTDQLNAQIQATNSCQQQLKDTTDQNAILQKNKTDLQQQISDLEGELKDAKTELTKIQALADNEQKEIVNLHLAIEAQAKTGVDDNTKNLDLSHENADLTASFNSVEDGLGVSRTQKTLEQITQDALSKEDDIDVLLKAAGLATGILHNMAKEPGLDDPKATPQQIADRIIQYVKGLGGKLQSLNIPKPQINKPTNGFNIFKWLGLWQ